MGKRSRRARSGARSFTQALLTSLIPSQCFSPTTAQTIGLNPGIPAHVSMPSPEDNGPYGDILTENKIEENLFRLAYQNPNGISTDTDYADVDKICQFAHDYKVDGLGLAGTDLDWNHREVEKQVKRKITRFFPHNVLATSSSAKSYDSPYQPGGTATLLAGNWTGRKMITGSDETLDGRWSYVTIQGKENTKLTMITGYRVSQDHNTHGVNTAYQQQRSLQRDRGIEKPDPRREFFKGLKTFVREKRASGHSVILMMDANEGLFEPKSQVRAFFQDTEMVDIIGHLHGYENEPPTYKRGNKRIDYIAVSPDLVEHVKRAGIASFGEGKPTSDHRLLFMDFDIVKVLRGDATVLHDMYRRRLVSLNSDNVEKYFKHLWKYLLDHNVEQRLKIASETIEATGLTPDLEARLNGIDRDITRGCEHAEKRLPKHYSLPWSPKLKKAKKLLSYWRVWLSELRTKKDLADQRADLARQAGIEAPEIRPTIPEAKHKAKVARNMLRAVVKEAKKYRQEHLEALIEKAQIEGNTDLEKARRRLLQAENQRHHWGRLRSIIGKKKSGSLNYILKATAWDEEGKPTTWQPIFDNEIIKAELLEQNTKHFKQAKGPMTLPEMVAALGADASTPLSDKILQGEEVEQDIPTEFTEATRSVLKSLKKLVDDDVDVNITPDDLAQGYKKWREGTSTSPSGRHLGHYKAWASPTPNKTEDHPRHKLLAMQAQMLNLAVQHQLIYDRWLTVFSLMLEKIQGQPRLEKLRIIHLYEADLNLVVGILWGRRLVWKAEHNKAFSSEQYGSRKGRQARDVLFLKKMTYLLSTLQLSDLATFDNDAKACYDRIVILLAMLRSRQLGMPQNACSFLSKFFQDAQYYIKTQMGVSEESHQCEHGSGQGNKGSPAMWLIVSTLLIDLMSEVTDGAIFYDPISKEDVRRIMDAFVDDTTIFLNLGAGATVPELAEKLREAAQWWENVLHTSGGKLELSKCFYSLLHWVFNEEGEPRIATKAELDTEIEIYCSDTKTTSKINHKDCSEAHKTLGAMESPSMNYEEEGERLLRKCQEFASKLGNKRLQPSDFKDIHYRLYVPSVGYSLPTTQFTSKELSTIQSPATNAFLSSFGYSRKTPREVVFGPAEAGGVGMRHLYPEQGTGQTMMLMGHLRSGGTLATHMSYALNWVQLHAGVTYPILESTAQGMDHMDFNWFISLRIFLHESNLNLKIDDVYTVTLRRTNDRSLAEMLLCTPFSATIKKCVNRVRLYLKVETISDIATADGTKIVGLPSSTSRHMGPNLPYPGPKSWSTWHSFMHVLTKSDNITLQTQLKEWHDNPQIWDSTYDEFTNCIVVRTATGWAYYPVIKQTRRYWLRHKKPLSQPTIEPQYSTPVDQLDKYPNRFSIPTAWVIDPPKLLPTTKSFNAYTQTLPEWERTLISGIEFKQQESLRLRKLLSDPNNKLIGVTDGGCTKIHGYYGWVLANQHTTVCRFRGIAYSGPLSSFRSEGYGRLSFLIFLYHIKNYYFGPSNRAFPTIETYCDNLALVKQERKFGKVQWTPTTTTRNDYDLVRQLEQAAEQCPIKYNHHHIKGHQDNNVSYHKLSWPAKLNVKADHQATRMKEELEQHHPKSPQAGPSLPLARVQLRRGTILITAQEKKTLRWQWPQQQLKAYLLAKHNWKEKTYQAVNWSAYHSARRKSTPSSHKFVTKLSIRFLPVNTRLHMIYEHEPLKDPDPMCARCNSPETSGHFYQCTAAKQWKQQFLKALATQLRQNRTPEQLNTEIVQAISNEVAQHDPQQEPTKHHLQHHNGLDWTDFLLGRLDSNWETHLDQHYKEHPPPEKQRLTGQRWTSQIIIFLWIQLAGAWQQRNDAQHEKDDGQQERYCRAEAIRKVKLLYKYKSAVGAYDRSEIFHRDLNELLQENTKHLENWTITYQSNITTALKDARRHIKKGTQDIRGYFSKDDLPP